MPDPLLELPAVRLRLAALDLLELRSRLVELFACARVVDLPGVDRVVETSGA